MRKLLLSLDSVVKLKVISRREQGTMAAGLTFNFGQLNRGRGEGMGESAKGGIVTGGFSQTYIMS